MGVPLIQQMRVGAYILSRKLRGVRRYPLVLMLEPLFQCNLSCPGCGKIAYSKDVLSQRMSRDECLGAVVECGAPVVSIAGGEPLLHPEMPAIVRDIGLGKRFVYLCTNALLLERHLGEYEPNPYLTFSIHLDGGRQRHDEAVNRHGTFDTAVRAIGTALSKGFRVTINCTLFANQSPEEIAAFFDWVTALGVEGITVAPGFSYERAGSQELFLKAEESRELFREVFRLGRGRRWRFNHSSLYLEFLAGNRCYGCTPWGNPTRNVFGWQRPCYLLVDEGYAPTFRAFMEETDWEDYGVGRNPKCADCMTHCGYEPSAVQDTFTHPVRALRSSLWGPRTEGPMAVCSGGT